MHPILSSTRQRFKRVIFWEQKKRWVTGILERTWKKKVWSVCGECCELFMTSKQESNETGSISRSRKNSVWSESRNFTEKSEKSLNYRSHSKFKRWSWKLASVRSVHAQNYTTLPPSTWLSLCLSRVIDVDFATESKQFLSTQARLDSLCELEANNKYATLTHRPIQLINCRLRITLPYSTHFRREWANFLIINLMVK